MDLSLGATLLAGFAWLRADEAALLEGLLFLRTLRQSAQEDKLRSLIAAISFTND
jgi:hypothetical protein